jgi:flagellar hook-length control protein FliK
MAQGANRQPPKFDSNILEKKENGFLAGVAWVLLNVTASGSTHLRPVSEREVGMLAPAFQIQSILTPPAVTGAPAEPAACPGGFSRALHRALQTGAAREAGIDAKAGTAQPPPGDKSRWLQQFKAQLAQHGVDCGVTAVDRAGLATLLPLLAAAGFDAQAAAGLFAELQAASDSGEVRLADLLAGLQAGAADSLNSSDDQASMLALSSLPYLETLLTAFGMPPADVDQVVAASKVEGQGIALMPLVDALHRCLTAKPDLAVRVADEKTRLQAAELMGRMGLDPDGPHAGGVLNLEQFIARLEKLADQTAGPRTEPSALGPQIDRFLEGCHTLGPQTPTSAGPFAAPSEPSAVENGMSAIPSPHAAGLETPRSASAAQGPPPAGEPPAGSPPQSSAAEAAPTVGMLAGVESRGSAATGGPGGTSAAASDPGLPAHVLNQVGRQIVRARLSDASEVRFQLKPPHLGRIQLTIDQGPEGLKVTVLTEQQAARDMLTAHAADLRAALQEQGIQLAKVDVQLSPDFAQTMADSRRDSARGRPGSAPAGARRNEGGETDPLSGALPTSGGRDNALNIVV